jgi:hypothetical protein
MATTTAAVTLASDLLSDNMSVTTDTTCMKGGSASDGLTQMDMGYLEVATGTNFDLLDAENTNNVNKANKVYVSNDSTDETYYVVVTIDAQVVGRLYAGDWMFIPWGAEDATADVEVRAYGGTNKLSYVYFHEGRLLASA